MDGLEAVTLSVSGIADQSILNAHRNQLMRAEAEAADGDVRQGDTIWQWPKSETPTRPPLGSTITDGDGNVGTILRLNEQVLGSKWEAITVNLAVEAKLDTLITIQVATYSKAAGGEAIATWTDLYTAVRAKVQPVTHTPEVEHDRDETRHEFRIILGADLAIDAVSRKYRVIDSALASYAITDYQQPGRIDELPVLLCERVGSISSSSSSSSSSSGA